jgi:indole-3-glycerol phosphate synthase
MILDKIVAHKKQTLDDLKKTVSLADLEERIDEAGSPRPFGRALVRPGGVALIAEVKKASPSAGVIRQDANPSAIGKMYEEAGASAVSVLTDEPFFGGTLADLSRVKKAVGLPILRKDFIIDPWQVYEARAYGADGLLLIVALLDDKTLRDLLALARKLGLEALVEVHTEEELTRAVQVGAGIIGINNRDLRTFHIDLETTIDLAPKMPAETIRVSESGIQSRADVLRLQQAGVNAVLVGTALMKAADVRAKITELIGGKNQR